MTAGREGENTGETMGRELTILNKYGIHARPAALFVKCAASFESEIFVTKDGNTVNGKSIMGVMMLAASRGTELVIIANGSDEVAAADKLEALIADRFGENE